jgi:hypothetical protein
MLGELERACSLPQPLSICVFRFGIYPLVLQTAGIGMSVVAWAFWECSPLCGRGLHGHVFARLGNVIFFGAQCERME